MKATVTGTAMDTLLDKIEWEPVSFNPEVPTENADLPFCTHEGKLEISGKVLRCYQLSDGSRIVDADDMNDFLLGRPTQ